MALTGRPARIALLVLLAAVAVLALYAARSRRMAAAGGVQSSGTQAADTERNEWDAGLGALSASNPAAFADLIRQITLLTELALARLGFAPGPLDGTLDPQTQEAIRRFEESRHLPVTGDPMSFATMKRVLADDELMDRRPVLLPIFIFSDEAWDAGRISARGTWRAADVPAAPDQTTSIVCERRGMVCVSTTALVVETNGAPSLSLDTASRDIETWTANAIATKADRDGVRLRVDKQARSVVEEHVRNGAVAKRRDLTDGSVDYITRFRDQLKARAALIELTPDGRAWLARQPDWRTLPAKR